MNVQDPKLKTAAPTSPASLLDRLAAGGLLAVLAAVAWMIVAAYHPDWLRLPSVELEVSIVLALLALALALVSAAALRRR